MNLDLARQQWLEGSRRLEQARRDPVRYARLTRQVELVVAELRRRVGQTFTLEELGRAYATADDWAQALLHEAEPEDEPPPETGVAADAAFHVYARGATDYAP